MTVKDKKPKDIEKVRWEVGVRDRGLGNIDFAVITKEKESRLVVECYAHGPDGHSLTSHIVELHNASLKKGKKPNADT